MARHKRGREKELSGGVADQSQQSGPSRPAGSPNAGDGEKQTPTRGESSTPRIQSQEDERSSSRGREKTSKGKRKVTFDVKPPAVVTIKREVNSEKEEEAALANQDQRGWLYCYDSSFILIHHHIEPMFELEDLEAEESSENSTNSKPTLQFVEQPQPPRPRKLRSQNTTGLPGSFSGLRPSSLPAPSHIRPPRSQHGSDTSTTLSLARPPPRPRPSVSPSPDPPAPVEAQDEAILKLVAADTPSHRGAWKPGTKAWQTFVRRKDSKGHAGSGDIPEEEAEDGLDLGVTEMTRPIKSWSYYNGTDGEDGGKLTLPTLFIILLTPFVQTIQKWALILLDRYPSPSNFLIDRR